MILDVRARAVEAFGQDWKKDFALGRWTDPGAGGRWSKAAAQLSSFVADNQRVIRRIPFDGRLTDGRALTAPATRPLRDRLRHGGLPQPPLLPSSQARELRVAFFPGCLTDRVLPEMGEAVLAVLRACGCEVSFPPDQHCCGLVAFNSGDRVRGLVMAQQTIRMLEGLDADYVLTNSTSCLAAVVQDYAHLLRDDAEWRERAASQAAKLIDFATFVDEVAQLDGADFPRTADSPVVTWHDACQSRNALGLGAGARRVITEVLRLELREMQDAHVCCGFGGSFAVDYPEVSSKILAKKLEHAAATAAHVIVSDNPGCLMQLRGGLAARNSPIRALHLAELMAERLSLIMSS
jgi:Fe-S oxidoreductase